MCVRNSQETLHKQAHTPDDSWLPKDKKNWKKRGFPNLTNESDNLQANLHKRKICQPAVTLLASICDLGHTRS